MIGYMIYKEYNSRETSFPSNQTIQALQMHRRSSKLIFLCCSSNLTILICGSLYCADFHQTMDRVIL